MACIATVSGCSGKSITVDNPVFADAPPRRSLVNQSADAEEQRLTRLQESGDVNSVSYTALPASSLSGASIVAEVNGNPIFVDDVMGGGRQIIERDPNLTDDQRRIILESTLKKRLPKYIEDELVMQALERKIPEDKRQMIYDSLEPAFLKVVQQIKDKEGFVTDQQLEERLASEGMSLKMLKDTFMRTQMVDGYVGSMCKVPATIDREVLVAYYKEHVSEYTPDEQVRFAEIVIRFRDHGGREGAEQAMTTVVRQIQAGEDFGKVAQALSDTLSAEKRGEIGWIKRGSLSDRELEDMLFEMPTGAISKVQVRDDRFEVYKVIDHRTPDTTPFQEVQREIETLLLNRMREEEQSRVRKELRGKGNVVTIFDNEPSRSADSGILRSGGRPGNW